MCWLYVETPVDASRPNHRLQALLSVGTQPVVRGVAMRNTASTGTSRSDGKLARVGRHGSGKVAAKSSDRSPRIASQPFKGVKAQPAQEGQVAVATSREASPGLQTVEIDERLAKERC